MKIYRVRDGRGKEYLYNPDNITQICWAWQKNASLVNFNENVREFGGAKFYTLNPNAMWIGNHYHNNFSTHEPQIEKSFLKENADQAIRQLISLRQQADQYRNAYFNKVDDVAQKNKASLGYLDNWILGLQTARNLGATIVVVGSSVITMPAATAAALLTTGAGIKGFAKFQDTGNIGAAGIEFVCEVSVGLVASGAKAMGTAFSTGEKVCVVLFAKIPAEAAKCAVGGDSLSTFASNSLVDNIGLPGLKMGIGKLLGQTPLPAIFKELGGGASDRLKQLTQTGLGVIENLLDDNTKSQVNKLYNSTCSAKGSNPNKVKIDSLKASHIDSATGSSHEDFVRKYCISRV